MPSFAAARAPGALGEVPVIQSDTEAVEIAHRLAAEFAVDAEKRDRQRILPFAQARRFSSSGLWAITVPRAYGGAELSFRTVAKVIEIISAADPSIGQIPQNHLSVAFQIRVLGTEAQQRFFFGLILNGMRLGNALAEFGGKAAHQFETTITPAIRNGESGYEIHGRKFYATGALFADFVSVGALDGEGRRLTAIVPRDAAGLAVIDDWSSFGQRTTASGTVILDRVFVPDHHVFPFHLMQERPVPNGAVAQIIQAAIDSGIAVAAIEDTKRLVREVARPWRDSGAARAADDPYTIAAIGRLEIGLHAAQALLGRAGKFVDRAIAAPSHPSVAEASVAVAEAKVMTTKIALEASNVLFELAGTRATLEPHRFDRHWRNARVHTLHDPVRWKYNVIGEWVLNDRAPPRHGLV